MKKIIIILLAGYIVALDMAAQISEKAFQEWNKQKYSMFIHFGIYSELGGVWEGKPVTSGYSEQIQSFAGIFSDWYGNTALRFDPINFNADSIVALAHDAGMKSIVFTAKHHDGFCMFKTTTTNYNSYDATPCQRDFIKELADACRRRGIRLGLYFSIIDWHFPQAAPISSHNCDLVTPQHHEFSKKQVTELLTHYGQISELWFDMGSNTPEQSNELYELVHRLQPDCMVSGRIGNDRYDFSVMADNTYPEGTLHIAWQSPASIFDETWSYRSWQKRGNAHEKAMEKLRSLIYVTSHGGNYLLNIGPKGDGSVVPFEAQVLREIGDWLKHNGHTIYETAASPFHYRFDWGAVTRKDNQLHLLLSGNRPTDNIIKFELPGYKLLRAEGKQTASIQRKNLIEIHLPADAYNSQTVEVITLTFDSPIQPLPMNNVKGCLLTASNATPNYSYSCFDFHSNYRSTISYSWNVSHNNLKEVELIYTQQEEGKEIDLTIDGKIYTLKLENGKPEPLPMVPNTHWGKYYLCGPSAELFDAPSQLEFAYQTPLAGTKGWSIATKEQDEFKANIQQTYYLMQEVESPKEQYVLLDIGAGNGVELYLNGNSFLKHLNPYRCTFRTEKVLLPLKKGNNQIVLRLYNRFEKSIGYLLYPSDKPMVYKQIFKLPQQHTGKLHTITVRRHKLPSPHTDTELSNLRIRFK